MSKRRLLLADFNICVALDVLPGEYFVRQTVTAL